LCVLVASSTIAAVSAAMGDEMARIIRVAELGEMRVTTGSGRDGVVITVPIETQDGEAIELWFEGEMLREVWRALSGLKEQKPDVFGLQ
jgi:hypothetical protein